MQSILNREQQGSDRSRLARIALCATLAAGAIGAACMVQVQPALAGERTLPQAAPQPAQELPATAAEQKADAGPALISGGHAQAQLRRARRELDEAQRSASTDEERRRIATAKQMLAVAEHDLAAAGSGQVAVDQSFVPGFDAAKLQEQMRVQMERINSPEFQAQLKRAQEEAARMQTPEFQARLRAMQAGMKAQLERMNSPEFQLQLKRAQEQAARVQSKEFQEQLQRMQERVRAETERINSPEFQERLKQLQEQGTLMARMEPLSPLGSMSTDRGSLSGDAVKVESRIMAENALTKKQPVYPAEAKEKKIQGEVLLHAIIGEDGKVEQLSVVHSPDESLSRSATDAVRDWTYKPYLLNGKPTAVETTITVHYSLAD